MRDDSNSGGDIPIILRGSRIEIDLRQMRRRKPFSDEGTSKPFHHVNGDSSDDAGRDVDDIKDGVCWSGRNKHLVGGKYFSYLDTLRFYWGLYLANLVCSDPISDFGDTKDGEVPFVSELEKGSKDSIITHSTKRSRRLIINEYYCNDNHLLPKNSLKVDNDDDHDDNDCSDHESSDEGTSKDGVGWRGSNKHLVKGKDITNEDNFQRSEDCTPGVENITSSLPTQGAISLQLQGLGFSHIQQQLMEKLEWYKKVPETAEVGYYDTCKILIYDDDVVMYQRWLEIFWKDIIAKTEMRPQRERSAFDKRWLFAGTNYRLMAEPLDIADYYKNGNRDYINIGRPKHYIKLQEWLEEELSASGGLDSRKREENLKSILIVDSCFWAHVEEALLSCRVLLLLWEEHDSDPDQKESEEKKLVEFEDYVYRLIKDYAVSPEIFLKKSSYMDWWNKYRKIKGDSYDSKLANFMRNPGNFDQYAKDAPEFSRPFR